MPPSARSCQKVPRLVIWPHQAGQGWPAATEHPVDPPSEMILSDLLLTLPGRYVVQSVSHSLTAAIVVESALRAWAIHRPIVQQRLRTLVVLLPIFAFPAYQLVDPDRGTMSSRLDALLNTDAWLYLELGWGVRLYTLFFLLLVLTAAVFVVQELVPIVRHARESAAPGYRRLPTEGGAFMTDALRAVPGDKPEIAILDVDDPLIFSTTGSRATIYLSRGIQELLTRDQLEAAIAHELAHIRRTRRPTLVMLFLLRVLMFFNPVVLIAFRRIVHGEENVCDDVAVSWTHNREALAVALQRLYHTREVPEAFHVRRLSDLRSGLEEYSHAAHIAERIRRLRHVDGNGEEGWIFICAVVAVAILSINYYVV